MKQIILFLSCFCIASAVFGQQNGIRQQYRVNVQPKVRYYQNQYNQYYQQQRQYWQQNFYNPNQQPVRKYNVQVGWGDVYNVVVDAPGYVTSEIINTAVTNYYQKRGYQTYTYPLNYSLPPVNSTARTINTVNTVVGAFVNAFSSARQAN